MTKGKYIRKKLIGYVSRIVTTGSDITITFVDVKYEPEKRKTLIIYTIKGWYDKYTKGECVGRVFIDNDMALYYFGGISDFVYPKVVSVLKHINEKEFTFMILGNESNE